MPVSPFLHDIVEQCEESVSGARPADLTLGIRAQSNSEVVRKDDRDTASTTESATESTISSHLARVQVSLNPNGGQSTNGPFFNHPSDFVLNHPIMVSNTHHHVETDKNALKILLKYTILGADFDSSERDPPPRCHPETRVALRERLKKWIVNPEVREKSFIWLKGPAGVGKSAVMQTISEFLFGNEDSDQVAPGASFFFWRGDSSGDRSDPSRLFTTIAYQLATRCNSYRDYLLSELAHDPKLPERAMRTQFSRFITRPFVNKNVYPKTQPITIIVDGLDECKGEREQCEIIQLIASFVTNHPTAPLLWLVSSRPESHLEAMFIRPEIVTTYKTEEILINSNESCADVERYLRSEFTEIRLKNPFSIPTSYQWPTEGQLLTIAGGAGGLFAFATTVIRFIDNPDYKDPRTLLDQVVGVIENTNKNESKKQNLVYPTIQRNPFAYLDALYSFILSTIPEDVFPITKKLLFVILDRNDWGVVICSLNVVVNFLRLTTHQALGALHKLNSVLHEDSFDPPRWLPTFWHKSFADFLEDESRSGTYFISWDDVEEEYRLNVQRIQREVINGQYRIENISLTSPDETEFSTIKNNLTRLKMLSVTLGCITRFWRLRIDGALHVHSPRRLNYIESEPLVIDWKTHSEFAFLPRGVELVRYFTVMVENQNIEPLLENVYELRIEDIRLRYCSLLVISSASGETPTTTTSTYDIIHKDPDFIISGMYDEKYDNIYMSIINTSEHTTSPEHFDAFRQKLEGRKRLVEPHQLVLKLEIPRGSTTKHFVIRNYITTEDCRGKSLLWDLLITYININTWLEI